MTPLRSPHRRPRRGAILLVVITLLALFAVVGLSFVLYAESAATGARIHREAANVAFPMPNPDDAANGFLRQLIYPNDPTVNQSDYLLSGLTGHELARLMYGHNLGEANDIPYNGLGLFHEQLGVPLINGPAALTIDRAEVVNHTLYRYDPLDPNTWLVVDPEYTRGLPFNGTNSSSNKTVRLGAAEVTNGGLLTAPAGAGNPNPFTYVGKNAPYTYPDRNNLAVALVNPTTGQVVVPSFHRPTLFGGLDAPSPTSATANSNWFLPAGRFKTVRPRRIDQLTVAELNGLKAAGLWPIPANPSGGQLSQLMSLLSDSPNPGTTVTVSGAQTSRVGAFPYPPMNPDGTITGDVQNLRFADGRQRNDSVWMDLNLPTFRGSNGSWKQYPKGIAPLVAAIVIPLDGRVNLNVAGNLRGGTNPGPYQHVSNQGFGPHEINPAKVVNNIYNGTALQPSDINPALVGQQLAGNRYSGSPNNNAQVPAWPNAPTLTSKLFQPDPAAPTTSEVKPPAYAQVDWSGTAGTATLPMGVTRAFNLPGQDPNSGLQSQPTYYGYYNDAANNPAQSANQPMLFNPYTRSAFGLAGGGVSGVYPSADIRRMDGRYSDRSTALTLTYLANANRYPVPFGSQTPPSLQPASATGPGMPGNITRALTTPYSNHLNRPGLAPNYLTTGTFQYNPTAGGLPYPTLSAAPQFNLAAVPQAPTPGTDLNISPPNRTAVRNGRAGLSAVDVNRPLADYRADRTKPLSATNIVPRANPTTPTQPEIDRQQLARDVFRRLVVASGANVTFDDNPGPGYGYPLNLVPPTGPMSDPTPAQYNAMRWLAQLSANIVDYIDNDDVSTAFVWNPVRPPMGPPAAHFEFDAANFAAAELKNRTVFGTEKPRLVINEAYAEVTNDKSDVGQQRAAHDFRVRFFVELLNPGGAEAATAVLAGPDPTTPGAVGLRGAGTASVYRVQVFDRGTDVLNELAKVDNVAGEPPATIAMSKIATPSNRLTMDLTALTNSADPKLVDRVEPNAGQPAATVTAMATNRNGFAVIGPQLAANDTPPEAFNPKQHPWTKPLAALMLEDATPPNPEGANVEGHLDYTINKVQKGQVQQAITDLNNDANKHVVLLRRLANPYLIESPTNPYLTVDLMSQVEVRDAVVLGSDPTNASRTPPAAQTRHAVGRVQPFAGYQPDGKATYTFPQSFAIDQKDTANTNDVQLSLFRHNYQDPNTPPKPTATNTYGPLSPPATVQDTLDAPFQWLVHLDRPLVSPAELFHVSAFMPHELTRRFARPSDTGAMAMNVTPVFHRHDLQHPRASATEPAGPLYADNSPLYRGLELLAVKPWTHAVPAGGRTPGKVNVNMIWDEYTPTAPGSQPSSRVLEALLDPQPGNTFNATADPNFASTLWQAIKKSRNPGWAASPGTPPAVGQTREEVAIGTAPTGTEDRPFRGFGGGLFDGGTNLGGVSNPADPLTGVQDTLLRLVDPKAATPQLVFGQNPAPAHPYQQWEPLRKVLNNLTTVTDTYLVIYTVGYFEVRDEDTSVNPPRRVLGAEAYNQVPGDLRAQYTGVIDRSMLGTSAGPGGVSARGGQTTDEWFTELVEGPAVVDARPTSQNPANVAGSKFFLRFYATGYDPAAQQVQVAYEGRTVSIGSGTPLRLGAGSTAETVFVDQTSSPNPLPRFDASGSALPSLTLGFDSNTGIATVTVVSTSIRLQTNAMNQPTVPFTLAFPRAAGTAVSGPFAPANPGAQAGFDRTAPQYQGVIPYHGRLYPGQ